MFTQLKRNKRFDNFIMLVWVQESVEMVFDNIEATFEFDPCDPQASCTGCDPAAIWKGDPWTHTNIMKLLKLLFLFSWVNIRSVRPIKAQPL